jgi:hypothetical protein
MTLLSSLFELREGKPFRVGEQTITVISRVLRLQVPGMPIGLVWNRPAEVRVRTDGASDVILPVIDETRRMQIILLGLGIAGSIILSALLKRR